MRKAIFDKELAAIRVHNKDTTKTWKEGVNKYTDATAEEFAGLRGYTPSARPSTSYHVPYLSTASISALPTTVDWRQKNVVTPPKDQGI